MARDVDGRRIAGRYELGEQLGEGGVGVVWRATDTLLGRQVAIKEVELPPAVRDQQRAVLRARVIREARAAARLSHPGAVTLFDVVQDCGQDYIVMELIDAPTLDQLVAGKGPLEPRHAAMLGLRLLATLEAAHRAGIVHRDVKPSNVLVRDDGTTKLTDFGTASLTGDPELTITGMVVGSPAFMAPEQIKSLEIGPATDLWALGATLYFAVEGEPPFKSTKTQFEVLNAIVNDPPRPARRLGPLAPVIDRLLTKESEDRPCSADVWYELRRVAAGQAEEKREPARAAGAAGAAEATQAAGAAEATQAAGAADAGGAEAEETQDHDRPEGADRAEESKASKESGESEEPEEPGEDGSVRAPAGQDAESAAAPAARSGVWGGAGGGAAPDADSPSEASGASVAGVAGAAGAAGAAGGAWLRRRLRRSGG